MTYIAKRPISGIGYDIYDCTGHYMRNVISSADNKIHDIAPTEADVGDIVIAIMDLDYDEYHEYDSIDDEDQNFSTSNSNNDSNTPLNKPLIIIWLIACVVGLVVNMIRTLT